MTAACAPESPKNSASDPLETDSDAPASDSASDSGATEPDATDSGATDSDTATGAPPPAECESPDPSVDATFELLLAEDWPGNTSNEHDIDVDCVVGQVSTGPTITSELLCDVDGQQRVATLKFAEPVLDEDYFAGEPVHLVSRTSDWDELDLGIMRRLSLRSTLDDRLLVVGVRDEVLGEPELFAPLTVDTSFPCGPEGFDEFTTHALQLRFASPDDGPVLDLISGHSGLLDSGAGFAYDIDVARATTNNCCHFLRWHEVLLRRVVVDG